MRLSKVDPMRDVSLPLCTSSSHFPLLSLWQGRNDGMRLQWAKQFFCCDFWAGCFMKRANLSYSTGPGLLCPLYLYTWCVSVVKRDWGTMLQLQELQALLRTTEAEVNPWVYPTLVKDRWHIYSVGNMPLPTYIIKIKQKQRNDLLGLWCFGCNFLSAIWLLRLRTISKQKFFA